MRLADDERRLSRVLIAPALLYIGALVGAPFVLAILYSLTSISLGGHSANFIGLENFRAISIASLMMTGLGVDGYPINSATLPRSRLRSTAAMRSILQCSA